LPAFNAQWLVVVCFCTLPSLSSPTIQQSLIMSLLSRPRPAPLSLFGPDTVVLVVVVAGGGAGLLAGTKPWWRTSWSSSASGYCCRLGGEEQGPALAAVVVVLAAFGPDAVVLVFVVITGGGAGLLAGTKSWRRISWSSSASGRHPRLGGKARGPALVAVVVVSAAGVAAG